MDRRTIIGLCASVPLLAPLRSTLATTPPEPANNGISRLHAVLPASAPATFVGERLRAHLPGRPDRDLLLADLGLDPTWTAEHMRQVLSRQRADDFAAGQTVNLDGWVLARCEAAFCLLLTLD